MKFRSCAIVLTSLIFSVCAAGYASSGTPELAEACQDGSGADKGKKDKGKKDVAKTPRAKLPRKRRG